MLEHLVYVCKLEAFYLVLHIQKIQDYFGKKYSYNLAPMGNNQQTLDDQPMGSGKHPGLDCSKHVGSPFVFVGVKSSQVGQVASI